MGHLNIGAFTSVYGMGGSQNSAVSLCNALGQRGHKVTLYCPVNEMFAHVEPKINLYNLSLNWLDPAHFGNVSIGNVAETIRQVRKARHDVILSFLHQSLFLGIPLLLLDNIPCVHYVLGPVWSPIMKISPGTFVVNCEETRDIIARGKRCDLAEIPVIRARVDIEALEAELRESDVINKYRPSEGVCQIVMLSRLYGNKMPGIVSALEAVKIAATSHGGFRFLLAGEGPKREEIERRIIEVNSNAGREVAKLVGYVGDVARFLSAGDIVLGIGRGAFEAMVLGKCTLIVGNFGYAGTVCSRQVSDLAYYNFAGRNVSSKRSPEILATELVRLLKDEKTRSELGLYAQQYIQENFAAQIGAKQFEDILLAEKELAKTTKFGSLRNWARYLSCYFIWSCAGLGKRIVRPNRPKEQLDIIARTRKSGARFCLNNSEMWKQTTEQ